MNVSGRRRNGLPLRPQTSPGSPTATASAKFGEPLPPTLVASSNALSDEDTIRHTYFRHGYALVVGVGKTPQYPEASLPVTVRDAQTIGAMLQHPERCGYPPAQVQVLTNATAGLDSLRAGLQRLCAYAKADPDATIVIYFSGHGWRTHAGRYALVPSDVRVDQLEHTVLWAEELTALLYAIPARRLLVCLDACHAAGVVKVKGADTCDGVHESAPIICIAVGAQTGGGAGDH
ncbi:MAG: caspase family protein [Blastochloris sp.]|nr:caspase family protein [Blastochloris sp.]